jgi:hypothetical protein
MSIHYRAVEWNRVKIVYDGLIVLAVAIYIAGYLILEAWLVPPQDRPAESELYVRAFGSATFLMLTAILSIGPLSRLDRRFLPLLYNRRHFGVLTFFVATAHLAFVINWFLATDALAGLASDLTNWGGLRRVHRLSVRGAGHRRVRDPSHHGGDESRFLAELPHPEGLEDAAPGPLRRLRTGDDACGARRLAARPHALPAADTRGRIWHGQRAACSGRAVRAGARRADGNRRRRLARRRHAAIDPDKRARIVVARGGERIAVFRDGGRIGALSNLCAHQNGPLGEGCIVDGYVTCPWHGYRTAARRRHFATSSRPIVCA